MALPDERRKEMLKEQKRNLKTCLDSQIREQEERRQLENAEATAYAEAEKEALRVWELETEEKRRQKQAEIEQLKNDRNLQLMDIQLRRKEVTNRTTMKIIQNC